MGHRLAARQIDPALVRNTEGEHEIAVQPTRSRARTVARAQSSYPARLGGRSVSSKRGPMTDAYVGVDVSKAWLDVAVRPSGEIWKVANDESGFAVLVEKLRAVGPKLVVMEATGGYQAPAAAALSVAGFVVAVVNPRQVRDFGRASGQLAKTDVLDAEVIARFAEVMKPDARPLPDVETEALRAVVARRRQLVEMIVAETNRLATALKPVRRDIEEHIRFLRRRLKDMDDDLYNGLKKSPLWRVHEQLLKSVPGVGRVTICTLIAQVPELGTLSGRKISALVGVAPLNRDSGTYRGNRVTWGGRAAVRHVLYMATLVSVRRSPTMKACYERLRSKGKPSKVALVACMRKLLVRLNAMMKTGTPWVEDVPVTAAA
jgi:transposase